MLKSLFISVNLVGLAMLPFLFVGNVSVEHQAPSEMEAGGEVEVTITLNKGAVTGPARLKLDFADAQGLSAESIETSGSSFSFVEGDNALFIWYSIQADDQITLKYKLKADPGTSGTKTISGTFSFLDEEERKKIDIPTIIVDVKGGTVADNPNTENTGSGSSAEGTGSATETSSEGTTSQVADDVTCNRSIEKDGDAFIVTIDVNKGSNGGFARIKDNVPTGFIAESVENSGAVFKFVDNSAKFLWTSLAKDKSSIQVKYRLLPQNAGPGTYELFGEFSGEFLIVDDKPTSIEIPRASFQLDGEFAGTQDPVDPVDPVDPIDPIDPIDPVDPKDPVEPETQVPSGNGEVMYKVQIMAAHRTVSNSYIKKHYGYSGKIDIENHEGWVKYTTGSYGVYKDARDKRNSLDSYNFPGPFVTAYKKGERITVQEALTLSNQQWVS